jgi:hypothetical protein
VFHPGGRATITKNLKALSIDVFNNRTNLSGGSLVTMDCSGFISAALAAAGLKITKNPQSHKAYQTSTSALIGIGAKSANSCIKPVTLTADEGMKAGDIVVFKDPLSKDLYGHTFMIESVGKDPFRLSSQHSAKECRDEKKYDPVLFDFTVIQSSASFGRMAATRTHIQDVLVSNPNLGGWLIELARKACLAKFQGSASGEVVKKLGKAKKEYEIMSLLRHVGPTVKECVEEKPVKVAGEECIEGCKEIGK